MMLLEPNRDQIEIFVQALFRYVGKDGFISMRAFYENDDSDKPVRITPTSLAGGLGFVIDVAEDDARRAANQPRATVFCPPVAVFNNKDHAREVDLLIGPALVVECDEDPQQARVKLEQLLGTATLVVRSGGQWTNPTTEQVYDRVHLYWRLAQGAKGDNLEKLKRARKLATYLVGGDTTNVPICHPIRWPGSWHCKNAPRLCEIVELHPDCEIDLDRALVVLTTAAPNVSTTKSGDPGRDDGEALDWSKSFGEIITGEHFHPTLVPLAASFAAHGLPELAARGVLRALLDSTQTKDPERLRRRDTELGKLRDTVHSGYKKFAAAVPTDTLLDPWAQAQLPDFPLATLPVIVGRFVERQSLIIGGCPSAMALSVLCALSGAIDHRFKVKMMRHGDWEARPRLWGLLVGDPSKKKTPIINAAARPLERWQRRLWREYQAQLRDHIAAGGKADDEDAPQEPLHYVVYDTTIEALGDALAKSSRGVLVKRDELAGWIASMERYGGAARGGSDRGFWLQVYDGEGYGFLRIKRGNIPISDFSVSILGGIQRAARLPVQPRADGRRGRGRVPVLRRQAGRLCWQSRHHPSRGRRARSDAAELHRLDHHQADRPDYPRVRHPAWSRVLSPRRRRRATEAACELHPHVRSGALPRRRSRLQCPGPEGPVPRHDQRAALAPDRRRLAGSCRPDAGLPGLDTQPEREGSVRRSSPDRGDTQKSGHHHAARKACIVTKNGNWR